MNIELCKVCGDVGISSLCTRPGGEPAFYVVTCFGMDCANCSGEFDTESEAIDDWNSKNSSNTVGKQ